MFLNNFYKISDIHISDDSVNAVISFNTDHAIFKGHFPGQPIVPGVCLIHILKGTMSTYKKRDLLLTEGSNIKFLNIIDPRENPTVILKCKYSIDNNMLLVSAEIYHEDELFFKFKGKFK